MPAPNPTLRSVVEWTVDHTGTGEGIAPRIVSRMHHLEFEFPNLSPAEFDEAMLAWGHRVQAAVEGSVADAPPVPEP